MAYYVFIKDEKIDGKGQCRRLDADVLNLEIEKEFYDEIEKYIYQDGEIVLNPNYEEEERQREAERKAHLFLTGTDVERGIYKAKGMDFADLIEMIETLQFAGDPYAEKIDVKELSIELKANNFFRGNPYVDAVGLMLGFTTEQLDLFFEYNDYHYLLKEEPETDALS